MKRLLALSGLAACMLFAGCARSYNTHSTAYHNRTYSTYRTSSTRHHERHSTGSSGPHHHHGGDGSHHRHHEGGGSHHHHHDGDHDKRSK
ncbi:MAG TPA: hypothetical protein VFR84_13390 [Candidatus Angelobacter sp.]|nr:hypothetical protein [Candidatus Angelobacter sp.]